MKVHTKVTSVVGAIMLLFQSAMAEQATATASTPGKSMLDHIPEILFQPMFYLWILVASILVAVLFTFIRVIDVLSKLVLEKEGIIEVAQVQKKRIEKEVTSWSKLMKSLTRAVPVEKEKDVLLDHNYDGIQELDNQLPPWWKWGFVVTIVFAFLYIGYYHFSGSGKLMIAEYNEEMNNAALAKAEMMKKNANMVTDLSVSRLIDESSLVEGKNTFLKYCVACHGDKGQGNVGPNLTDEYWLHGGGIKHIFHTITEGVPVKGMISWKTQLSPKQIQQVASYVLTLQGTNPPGAKAAQGDLYSEEPAAKIDSIKVIDKKLSAL